MQYSVIIPTFNAEKFIKNSIASLRSYNPDCEIIVADGGSTDRSMELIKGLDVVLVATEKGRGIQMNAGARRATGDVLFFLHADTIVTKEVFTCIDLYFQDEKVNAAKCSLKFDRNSWLLTCYARIARFDCLWTSFGDQGLAVRKKFFDEIGGFPDWPLLEDVAFFQKARKRTKIFTLPATVITSAERFVRNGLIRQQLFNARIMFKYLCGVPPSRLASQYEQYRNRG